MTTYTRGQRVRVTLDTSAFEYREGDWPGVSFPGTYLGMYDGAHEIEFIGVDNEVDLVILDDHELKEMEA